MNTDLRTSLIASGAGALLSAIVGMIAGVPFFVLLFRALGLGLAIGALLFGALFLMRRFMPELFEESAVGSGAIPAEEGIFLGDDQDGLGDNVNIVLPAEGPPSTEEFRPEAQAYESRARPGIADVDDEDAEMVESLIDDADGEPGALPPRSPGVAIPKLSGGFEDLDVLPDLDSLSDGFIEPVHQVGSTERHGDSGGASGRSHSKDGGAMGSDPAVLAQAVRTLLKRDQKG